MGRPTGWMQKLTGRGAMRSPGAPSHRREIEQQFWAQIATGITSEKAAQAVGVSQAVGSGSKPLDFLEIIGTVRGGRSTGRQLPAVQNRLFQGFRSWLKYSPGRAK